MGRRGKGKVRRAAREQNVQHQAGDTNKEIARKKTEKEPEGGPSKLCLGGAFDLFSSQTASAPRHKHAHHSSATITV